jgi:hypothetical protein
MKKFIWGLLLVSLIACLVLPASVFAETPLSLGTVASNAATDGLGSPFQHHSFVADGVMWVFYQDDATDQILCSWSEDGTTWVAHAPITWCKATTAATVGGQFDTWYNVGDDTVRFVVVNTSINNSAIYYRSYAINAVAHTLTPEGLAWNQVVGGVANVSYRNPTICVTNNASIFVTYGYVENGSSDVYVMTTNDSTDAAWLPEVGFPMSNLDGNVSLPAMYGSVIPLYTSLTNVSVQYAGYNGSVYKINQLNINWNGTAWNKDTVYDIDTSNWYLPTGYEWNYNAVSIATHPGLILTNDNDVVIQCGQTDGASLYRTFTNRRANESDAWGSSGAYARNFGSGGYTKQYIGAMGMRNAIYSIVFSSWDMAALSTDIQSNDFDAVTGNWDGIAIVDTDLKIPFVSTMSDYRYDPSGTGYIGFLYGTTTDDTLMYGLYGPAPAASTIPASVTTMAWIVILVFGALICIILLAYGASESIKGHSTEFVKIGAIGLLTLIVAAIIVEALL